MHWRDIEFIDTIREFDFYVILVYLIYFEHKKTKKLRVDLETDMATL